MENDEGKENLATEEVTTRKKPHVPGQYLGYSLQATRFLAKLLESDPDSTVSLEVFEDIGVESNDGYRTAEQDKSATNGNPISDRSVDLWKTFSNWIDAVECGDLQIGKTSFEIYVSQPVSGEIVRKFSDAHSIKEAHQALTETKNKLWGSAPEFNLKSKVSDSIQKYVTKVFESNETIICGIIAAFTFLSGSGSSLTDLKVSLTKKFVPPEIIDDVLTYSLGWVKEQTDVLLEQKKPACIKVGAFFSNIMSYIRKLDRRSILVSFANDPNVEEIEADLKLMFVSLRLLVVMMMKKLEQ